MLEAESKFKTKIKIFLVTAFLLAVPSLVIQDDGLNFGNQAFAQEDDDSDIGGGEADEPVATPDSAVEEPAEEEKEEPEPERLEEGEDEGGVEESEE